jgi:2-iminobutanoate/2-iminopropanoate deaminase
MARKAVSSHQAPEALGPYSQAIVAGDLVFCSGMAGVHLLNEVYARHMPDPPPARSAPAHVRLPRGLLVSIEAIAVLPTPSE